MQLAGLPACERCAGENQAYLTAANCAIAQIDDWCGAPIGTRHKTGQLVCTVAREVQLHSCSNQNAITIHVNIQLLLAYS